MTIGYKKDDTKSGNGVEYYTAFDIEKGGTISIKSWAQSLSQDSSKGAQDRLEFNRIIAVRPRIDKSCCPQKKSLAVY